MPEIEISETGLSKLKTVEDVADVPSEVSTAAFLASYFLRNENLVNHDSADEDGEYQRDESYNLSRNY